MDGLSVTVAIVLVVCVSVFLYGRIMSKAKKPIVIPEGRMGRELDPWTETILYKNCLKGSLNLCNVLFFATKQPLSEYTIRGALRRVGLRHPLCRMRVTEEEDGRCVFRELDNFEVDIAVSQSSDWMVEFERQLKTQYEVEKGPLWRVVLMPQVPDTYTTDSHPFQNVIVFGFNHAMIDGTSYCKIFNEFIDDLEAVHQGDISEPLSQELPPPMDSCIPLGFPMLAMVKLVILASLSKIPLFKRLIVKWMVASVQRNPWVAAKGEVSDKNPNCEMTTSMIPLELDRELTKTLMQKCKAEGATLQGAFQVATMAAMAQILGNSINLDEVQWSSNVTVNLRRVFPQQLDSKHVVPYFGPINCTHKLPVNWKDNFWQFAKEVSKSLHGNMVASMMKTLAGFATIMACGVEMKDLFQSGSRSSSHMGFTNLGNCSYLDRPEENNVQLKARFGGSGEHNQGHTMASNIMTLNGKICWSLIYYKNVMRKDDAVSMAQGIQTVLRDAAHLS